MDGQFLEVVCFSSGLQTNNIRITIGYIDESFSSMSTPVGPVAGAIMGMFVVLVIVVYCYRHHVGRLVEGRNNTSGMYNESGGTRLCGATLDDDNDNEYHFDHDGSKADEGIQLCLYSKDYL